MTVDASSASCILTRSGVTLLLDDGTLLHEDGDYDPDWDDWEWEEYHDYEDECETWRNCEND